MDADKRDDNRAMWDERAPIHAVSDFYDTDGLRAGRDPLRDFEPAELGPVDGLDLLHLQCHIGTDTIGWARRGATITGLDFSAPALAAAQQLASDLGIESEWIEADVYDAVDITGRKFDVVYTGLGALAWLADIGRWAHVVADLLRPGGVLYLVEFHPFTDMFPYEGSLAITTDYFHDAAGEMNDISGTYTDTTAETVANRSHEWRHPISDVLTSVLDAGLTIETFNEHDYTLYARFPFLEREPDGIYRLPPGTPRMPLMYSLLARLSETCSKTAQIA